MKKNVIESGLNGLLNPQTPAHETPQEPKETGNYKIVCYNLRTDIVEKLDYIAYWDRKKKNAVINEALEAYIANWKPQVEKPKKF